MHACMRFRLSGASHAEPRRAADPAGQAARWKRAGQRCTARRAHRAHWMALHKVGRCVCDPQPRPCAGTSGPTAMRCIMCVACCEAARCTLHVARCMLHAVCCTLHAARCMLHAVCCTLYAASCMLHIACCTLYAARCALHVVCCKLHVVCCKLHAGEIATAQAHLYRNSSSLDARRT
jgi:hypothetical protein